MIERIKVYVNRTRKIATIKLLLSMFISIISINIMTILNDKLLSFFMITLVTYIVIDISYDYLVRNGKSIYFDISNYLYDLQDLITNDELLLPEIKKIIDVKILTVRDEFVAKIVTLRFLNSDIYNSETEFNNLLLYATNTLQKYNGILETMGVNKKHIKIFNDIHEKPTRQFIDKMKHIIYSESTLLTRQAILTRSLKLLMKQLISEYISATDER